jgi:hypothetical protein
MAWVTNLILVCDAAEAYPGEFKWGMEPVQPPGIIGIDTWLRAGNWAALSRLDDHILSDKTFGDRVYGAALNYLDVPGFLATVASQPWQDARGVLLLLRDQEAPKYTVYRLVDGAMRPDSV